MTDINLDSVSERDADIVIMREFNTNRHFADLFLQQIGISDCDIQSIEHSVMDAELGESDIEIHISHNGKRVCLMVENKINAVQQPKQYKRYIERGEKKIKNGETEKFHVFMTAPQAYLSSTKEYSLRVAYEDMLRVTTDPFSAAVLSKALEKKNAYQPIPDERVSIFWKALYKYVSMYFSDLYALMPTKTNKPRGTKAQWPGFRTNVPDTSIQWKADKGYVDLQLDKKAGCVASIKKMLSATLGEHPYEVHQTGQSASIRKTVPKVNFHQPFAGQQENVNEALCAVSEIYDLAQDLNEEIKHIEPDTPSPLLLRAIAIATETHRGQTDKAGADYIGHPLRVAQRLTDEKEKIVAVLHDTIEDTFVTPEYLAEQGFTQEIIDGVLSVTRQDGETYDAFVHRAARNPLGRAVKQADLEDNMDIRRLNYPMNDWDFERLNKYLKAYKYISNMRK